MAPFILPLILGGGLLLLLASSRGGTPVASSESILKLARALGWKEGLGNPGPLLNALNTVLGDPQANPKSVEAYYDMLMRSPDKNDPLVASTIAKLREKLSTEPPVQTVTINGHQWILEKTGSATRQTPQGTIVEANYLVSTPAMQFGPHIQAPIIAFGQIGDDPNTRQMTARYPAVPEAWVQMALKDWNVKATF